MLGGGGDRGGVSNLTFDPTNKKHESSRIALQRGAPVAARGVLCVAPLRARVTDTGFRAARITRLRHFGTKTRCLHRAFLPEDNLWPVCCQITCQMHQRPLAMFLLFGAHICLGPSTWLPWCVLGNRTCDTFSSTPSPESGFQSTLILYRAQLYPAAHMSHDQLKNKHSFSASICVPSVTCTGQILEKQLWLLIGDF